MRGPKRPVGILTDSDYQLGITLDIKPEADFEQMLKNPRP